MDLDAAAFESKNENSKKLLKGVEELHTYVERNQEFVPNYGERYRNGEKIASGFVESAINQVVSKRMVKKQQMGWSQRGDVSAFLCVGRFSYKLITDLLPRSETTNELAPRLIHNRPGPVGCENAWDRYATSQQHAGPEKGDCG